MKYSIVLLIVLIAWSLQAQLQLSNLELPEIGKWMETRKTAVR